MEKGQGDGSIVTAIAAIEKPHDGFTAAQLAIITKATLTDFVRGNATRAVVHEISQLLGRAIECRKLQFVEEDRLAKRIAELDKHV